MKKFIFLIIPILFGYVTLCSQVIHVPADQPTIQDGIMAADDGDIVLVAEGTYLENINFYGKAITVASEFFMDGDTSHISNTVIDGSEPDDPDFGSVVTFESGEDTTSVLVGFTLRGGTGTLVPLQNATSGGAIQAYPAGCKIMNNIIEDNSITTTEDGYGAAVLCDHKDQSWLVLVDNTIRNNQIIATGAAWGAVSAFGNARIENNTIIDNSCSAENKQCGGGITCQGLYYDPSFKEIIIKDNLIEGNTAYSQSNNTEEGGYNGGLLIQGYYGIVHNNVISGNSVSAGSGKQCYGAGMMSLRNSNELIAENNIISNNYFTEGSCVGGGLCVWSGGGLYQNNVIYENIGTYGGGISVNNLDDGELAVFINNTIVRNNGQFGGGIYFYNADAIVFNSILWANEAFAQGNEIYEISSMVNVQYTNVQGGWEGEGNLDVDPLFMEDGYHLKWSSPLANQGEEFISIGDENYECPEYDIDSEERPFQDTQPDIGADETEVIHVTLQEIKDPDIYSFDVFPNPSNNNFSIAFELNNQSFIQLIISDQSGKRRESLTSGYKAMGNHLMIWDAENYPPGIYYIQLIADHRVITRKLIKM